MTFGTAVRFYSTLAVPIRTEVAAHFSVTSLPVFDSWVSGFVDLRNICAHHDRLFNRRFQKQPKKLRRAGIPSAQPPTMKAQLECLDYVLSSASVTDNVVKRTEKVLNSYPEIQNSEAGF